MGNMLSIKPDIDEHIRSTDDNPVILLEIYQSDRNALSSIAKQEGHSGGVCEGLCCVWAKYNCAANQDYFITHFDPEMIRETVEAHGILKKLKEQTRGRLDECGVIIDKLSGELEKLLQQPATTERDARIRQIDKESRLNSSNIDMFTESADDLQHVIHGLQRKDRKSDLKCDLIVTNLTKVLNYCVNTNNVCIYLLHKAKSNRSQAGHCIGFSAEGKRKIHFMDANSCLYEFSSIEACVAFFKWYWDQYYASDYQHYTLLASGLPNFM